jgi:hypothetical protein
MTEPNDSPQEEDTATIGVPVLIGLVTLVIFAAGLGVVLFMMKRSHPSPRALIPPPREVGRSEIGIVDQPVFEGDRRLGTQMRDQKSRLESYGWSNRDAGLIHVPVEQAMDRVAAGQAP